jgi:hypothetical protein
VAHAAVAGEDQLPGAVLRRAREALDRGHRRQQAGPLDAGEDRLGDRLAGRRVEQDAAGVGERQAGTVELLAVAQALALALLAHSQLQLAVQSIEVLQHVVLAALGGDRRERDQRRQPSGVGHLGQVARAAARRLDGQCSHACHRQGPNPAESGGYRAQFGQPLERGDQAGGGRLHRRSSQALKLRLAAPGSHGQEPLKTAALLVGEGAGEQRPAALVGVLARGSDQPPEGAGAGQQHLGTGQVLDRAGEQHRVAFGADPRSGAQPRDQLFLDAGRPERSVAVLAADLFLVRPAPLPARVGGQVGAGGHADLPRGPLHHRGGDLSRVLQEAAEVAQCAQLEREPQPGRVRAPAGDQPPILVIEEEAAGELIERRLLGDAPVVSWGRSGATAAGGEAQDLGDGGHAVTAAGGRDRGRRSARPPPRGPGGRSAAASAATRGGSWPSAAAARRRPRPGA